MAEKGALAHGPLPESRECLMADENVMLSGFRPRVRTWYIPSIMGVRWHTRPRKVQADGYSLRPVVQRGKRLFSK